MSGMTGAGEKTDDWTMNDQSGKAQQSTGSVQQPNMNNNNQGNQGGEDITFLDTVMEEVEADLAACGYEVTEVRDAPDRPGKEFVYLARRP